MLKDLRLFYSECRTNFGTIGAIAPSSPLLAKAIILPLQHRPRRPISVLEAGAGTGSFTHRILSHLRFGDTLDIFELNPKFYSFLKRSLRKARLSEKGIQCRLHNADIRTLRKQTQYDFIISGLPLNNFDSRTVSEILQIYLDHLSPTGVLSYFEYILTQEFKSKFLKPAERDRLIQVAKTIGKFVEEYQYSCYQVWWNLPPAKARHFRKTSNLIAGSQKERLSIYE
jgi:phosphatidylethanolamine/phosphatidyl-N-methylethanolamine N-methyltransferase